MKKYVKILALTFAILMAISVFGCDNGSTVESEPTTESITESRAPEQSESESESDNNDIAEHTHEWKDANCTDPKTCTVCGATEGENLGGHSGGQATCLARAKCEKCGKVYGAVGTHNFDCQNTSNEYLVSDATITAAARYYYSCSYCGEKGTGIFTSGGTIIDSLIDPYNKLFDENAEAEGFLYFTDPHPVNCESNAGFWHGREAKIEYLGKLYEASNASFAICGGDWLNNSNSKDSAMKILKDIRALMTDVFGEESYLVVGNHDYNYQKPSEPNYQNPDRLTKEELAECWYPEYGKTYYTFTTKASRFYVFDSGIDWGHENGLTALDIEQVVWLLEELAKNDDKHIVMAPHMMFISGSTPHPGTAKFAEICAAYNAREVYTYDGKTYDFSKKTGKVEYFIAGHTHADMVFEIEGIPAILVDTMQNGDHSTADFIYVDYTEGKIYLNRVGAGADRVIDLKK